VIPALAQALSPRESGGKTISETFGAADRYACQFALPGGWLSRGIGDRSDDGRVSTSECMKARNCWGQPRKYESKLDYTKHRRNGRFTKSTSLQGWRRWDRNNGGTSWRREGDDS